MPHEVVLQQGGPAARAVIKRGVCSMTILPPTCTWALTARSDAASLATIRHDRTAERTMCDRTARLRSRRRRRGPLDHENPQVRRGTPPETRTRNPLVGRHVLSPLA